MVVGIYMQKLIIALESNQSFISATRKELKEVLEKGKRGKTLFRLSFVDRKNFNRFMANIHVLQTIIKNSPESISELAQLLNVDRRGVVKILNFFEKFEILKYHEIKVGKRVQKKPIVEFKKIEIDLAA